MPYGLITQCAPAVTALWAGCELMITWAFCWPSISSTQISRDESFWAPDPGGMAGGMAQSAESLAAHRD
jgi:hypothetical protein